MEAAGIEPAHHSAQPSTDKALADLPFPKLAEVVQRLIEACAPERVYLFGSSAREDAGPDSDYDILLVVPDDATPERKRAKLAYGVSLGHRDCRGRTRVDPKQLRPPTPPSYLASGNDHERGSAPSCRMTPSGSPRCAPGSRKREKIFARVRSSSQQSRR